MTELGAGTRLRSNFEITKILGGGKASLVYLAHDHALGREVVIKEYLPVGLAYRDRTQINILPDKRELFQRGLERFFAEANVMTRFVCGILRGVLECFKENGTAYIVMPFYPGVTLRQKVRDNWRAKDLFELFGIIFPLLEGVSILHNSGYLHLDISPDNVLFRGHDAPLLLDFGAASQSGRGAKQIEDRPLIELAPGFAAKEQYETNGELGAWTDIYAISALTYYIITGVIPEVSFSRIVYDPLKPLASYCTDEFPASVLLVFDKGLTIEPETRFRDIVSLTQELQHAVRSVMAQSRNPVISGMLTTDAAVLSVPQRERSVLRASWELREQLRLHAERDGT